MPTDRKRRGLEKTNAKSRRSKKRTVVRKHLPFCFYCQKALLYREITLDHVKAWHKGGTNENGNLVPACRDCNQRKGHKSVDLFIVR